MSTTVYSVSSEGDVPTGLSSGHRYVIIVLSMIGQFATYYLVTFPLFLHFFLAPDHPEQTDISVSKMIVDRLSPDHPEQAFLEAEPPGRISGHVLFYPTILRVDRRFR